MESSIWKAQHRFEIIAESVSVKRNEVMPVKAIDAKVGAAEVGQLNGDQLKGSNKP